MQRYGSSARVAHELGAAGRLVPLGGRQDDSRGDDDGDLRRRNRDGGRVDDPWTRARPPPSPSRPWCDQNIIRAGVQKYFPEKTDDVVDG